MSMFANSISYPVVESSMHRGEAGERRRLSRAEGESELLSVLKERLNTLETDARTNLDTTLRAVEDIRELLEKVYSAATDSDDKSVEVVEAEDKLINEVYPEKEGVTFVEDELQSEANIILQSQNIEIEDTSDSNYDVIDQIDQLIDAQKQMEREQASEVDETVTDAKENSENENQKSELKKTEEDAANEYLRQLGFL